MASTLYKSIFKKGKAETYAEVLVNHLVRRLGVVDPAVRERIRKMSDLDTLKAWYNEVVDADMETTRRLVDKIRNASLAEAPAP